MADDTPQYGGQARVQAMLDAGAPEAQVHQWQQSHEQAMLQSGAPPEQVYEYWNGKVPDTSRIDRQTAGNAASIPPEQQPHVAQNPWEALEAGMQSSVTGLAIHGPQTTVPSTSAGFLSKTLTALGQTAGDLPATVAGMAVGAPAGAAAGAAVPGAGETGVSEAIGGLAGMGAGGMAAPEAMRETLMDYYQHRGGSYFQDFWSRFGKIALNVAKTGAVGAVTMPIGGAVGGKVLDATGSAILGTGADLTTQAATATTMGSAMEGKMPDKSDFMVAAVTMLGLHAAGEVVGGRRLEPNQAAKTIADNTMTLYAKTGLTPAQIVQMAQKDPAFKAELMAPKNAQGDVVARSYFGQKPPEPPPFKTNPMKIQDEHDNEMQRIQSDGLRGADEATKRLPISTLSTVRTLEGSGDQAVSRTGAVGRYQIEPGTARQYGFDPVKLTDPTYNEHVASVILADLQTKFKGNLADMLVAYNAGPGRARTWINGGRVFSDLPLETQRYLEHAERIGSIEGNYNTTRVDLQLTQQGDGGGYVPPEGTTPLENMQNINEALHVNPTWSVFGRKDVRDSLSTTIASNGDIYPAPRVIATYLQKFGRMAGFRFQTGPAERYSPEDYQNFVKTNDKAGFQAAQREQPGAQFQMQTGRDRETGEPIKAGHVYVPNNPEEINRRWYGLGSSEILFHEAGHAIDFHVLNSAASGRDSGTKYLPEGDFKDELTRASKAFRPKLWAQNPSHMMKPAELMADAVAQWISNPTIRGKMPLFGAKYAKVLEPYVAAANMSMPKLRTPGDAENEASWQMPPDDAPDWKGWGPEPGSTEPPQGGGKGRGGSGAGGGKPPPPPGTEPGYGSGEPPRKPDQIKDYSMHLNADMLADKIMEIVAPEVKEGGLPDWLNPRKWIAMFQSELTPAREVDKKIGVDTGKQMGIEDLLRQTYASRERAGYFIRYGTLDPTLKNNEITETSDDSFMKAYGAVKEDGGDLKNFMAYRLARRTVEKAKQGIDTGVDLDIAKAFLRKREKEDGSDRYERANDIMRRVKDASIDYATNSGLFSPEMADATKELNQEHIVFRRQIDPQYNPRPGKGFGVRQPLKKMEGSDRLILDPVSAEIDNLHTIIAMSDRNRALGAIIGAIEQHGLASEKSGLPAVIDMQKVYEEPVKPLKGQLLDEEGKPIPEKEAPAAEPFLAGRRAMGRMGPNDFMYFRAGRPEIWRVSDPDLADVLRMSWPGRVNPVAELAIKFASLARAGITGDFGYPFRAVTHGQIAAAAFANKGTKPYHDVMTGMMDTFSQGDAYKEWVRNGGAGSAITDMDVNYIQKDINAVFDKTDTTFSVWNTVKHPIQAMQALQHRVDASSRVGYTQRLIKQGYDPMKAATMARTAYLDNMEGFSAGWVNTWSRMAPFMRVGFKDIEQVGSAIAERPVGALLKAATWVTAPTLINYIANYYADKNLPDGQKYTDLPKWEKDLYWVLPPIDGVRMKIKKPYVGGFLFATMPERFMDYARNDTRAFEEWGQSMVAQYMPPFMPSVITPEAEQFANKSFFTQRPLIKASLEKASGYMQYEPDTSETAKAISRVLGPPGMDAADVSPIVIQNYAREWLGTLPMTILRTMEMPYKEPGKPEELADLPFVGSFIARNPGMGAQPIIDFYNASDKIEAAHQDFKLAMERQDFSEIKETAKLQAFINLSNIKTALRHQSAVVNAIDTSKTMTRAEKLKYTDSLYGGMVQEAKAGLTMVDQINGAAAQQQEQPDVQP